MGFYLRKSFSAGPIRINLSKRGIGVSAGVKGLRVGTGPRGAYVSGGRYGLYFRESLGGSGGKINSFHSTDERITSPLISSNYSDEIFINTGVTYPSNIKKTNVQIEPPPQFTKKHKTQNKLWILGLLSIFIGLIASFNPFYFLGTILLIGAILLSIDNIKIERNKKRTIKLLNEFDKLLHTTGNVSSVINSENLRKVNQDCRNVFYYQAMMAVIKKYIEQLDTKVKDRILKLKDYVKMSDQTFRSVKIRLFESIFDEYMRDHLLEEDEERILRNFAENLGLTEYDIQDELQSIEIMSKIRQEINSDLTPIPTRIKLPKSENCFYSSEARLLKKKILKTQTIQGIKYKHVGYVIEKEGTVHLTNERILIVAEGTSTIKLEKVFDITVTPEANIVELIVEGRKAPMIFTLPGAMVFGAKIEKIKETYANR
jgi:hypothetical protein